MTQLMSSRVINQLKSVKIIQLYPLSHQAIMTDLIWKKSNEFNFEKVK